MLEAAEDSINNMLTELDLSSLTGEQRSAIAAWHRGIQQACTSIRLPE